MASGRFPVSPFPQMPRHRRGRSPHPPLRTAVPRCIIAFVRSPLTPLLVLTLSAGALTAQQASGPAAGETRTVVPGADYGAGGLYRLLFGSNYRQLWTHPIQVPVLDLAAVDGGLRPTTRGGGKQTKSLRFKSPSGREYSFRSVDKDPSAILPPEFEGTAIQRVVRDQISAGHPFSALVAEPFTAASGAPSLKPALVVLPDDQALGEFRADFAGVLGYFEVHPDDGPDGGPGFAGFVDVRDTEELLERRREQPDEVVDVPAFLAVRLVDLVLGDWDRHRGQWRWGRVAKSAPWTPLPEDRDQALASYGGLLLAVARTTTAPQLVKFGPDYSIPGLTWNGRDLDRELLPRLDRAVWDSVAAAVAGRMTDSLLDAAVAALPVGTDPEHRSELRRILSARRDKLPWASREFYLHFAREADIHGTDAGERFSLRGTPDGMLRLEADGGGAGTRIVRRFDPDETTEIRIYAHGGADTVAVEGPTRGIRVRFIGGDGADVASGAVRMYQDGTAWRALPTEDSPPPPRDWGSRSVFLPFIGVATDIGLVAGTALTFYDYGFRKEPYASRIALRLAFATGSARPGLDLDADFRTENPVVGYRIGLRATGLDQLRFYGLGNETVEDQALEYYQVPHWLLELTPTLELRPEPRLAIGMGPLLRYFHASAKGNRLIAVAPPYGADGFGEAGLRGYLRWDSRDVPGHPRKGVAFELGGEFQPQLWDVEETFGSLHAEASTALSFGGEGTPVIALRAGGRRVFGDYPFFAAATIGGGATLRGYSEQRFRGDDALYGNAELRVPVGHVKVIVPAQLGIFGLADAGRVFLDGESSDKWHRSFGGGLWLAWLGRPNTLSAAVARSPGRTGFYIRAGFLF